MRFVVRMAPTEKRQCGEGRSEMRIRLSFWGSACGYRKKFSQSLRRSNHGQVLLPRQEEAKVIVFRLPAPPPAIIGILNPCHRRVLLAFKQMFFES